MIKNCGMLQFRKIESVSDKKLGALTPIEFNNNIPFFVQRIYYIYDVDKKAVRGFHSHRKLHQVLIAVSGSIKIKVKTPYEEEIIKLDNPTEGLYIGPLIWREMFEFSSDAVLLVLASEKYDEGDYIRNWDSYVEEGMLLFGKSKKGE